jgi:hypothetical protein
LVSVPPPSISSCVAADRLFGAKPERHAGEHGGTNTSFAEPYCARPSLPPQILPRVLATPSLLAHILSDTFCDGRPFHHQEC